MGSDPYNWDDESQWETISDPYGDDSDQWTTIAPPTPEPEQGYLEQWENSWLNQPLLDQPSQAGRYIANQMDEETIRRANSGKWDAELGLNNPYVRGLASGLIQGTGDVISGFSTPLNLATMGTLKGAGMLAKSAPVVARGLGLVGRGLSAPVVAGGAAKMYDEVTGEGPIDWTRFGMAGTEVAGGILGLKEPIPSGRTRVTEAPPPPPAPFAAKTIEQLLPPDVIAGFSPEQRAAVQAQFDARQPIRPPGPIHGPDQPLYPSMQRYYEQAPTPAPMFDPNWAAAIPDEAQGQLGFGAYRGTGGRFTNQGPGAPPKFGPEVGTVPPQSPITPPTPDVFPQQGGLDLSPSEPPAPTGQFPVDIPPRDSGPMWPAPAANPFVGPEPPQPNLRLPANTPDLGAPKFSADGNVVTLPRTDPTTVQMMRDQGFVPVPDLRGANGEVMMVKGDIAPLYVTGDRTAPQAEAPSAPVQAPDPGKFEDVMREVLRQQQAAAATPEVPNAFGAGELRSDDIVPVPKEQATTGFIANMLESGYKIGHQTPTTTFFERIKSQTGAVNLGPEGVNVPREGAMTMPSEMPPTTMGVDTLRQQNVLGQGAGNEPIDITPTPPVRPELPQYPPRPLRQGETHAQRLEESRRMVREAERTELDNYANGNDDTPGTTGIVQRVKQVADDLLKKVRGGGEEGVLNIPDLIQSIRNLAGRGDEVDNASPRQRDADLNEVNAINTVEDASAVRNHWRDRISQMSDRELQTPEGVHARDMLNALRRRVNELMEAETNRPPTPEEMSASRNRVMEYDRRQIQEATDVATLDELYDRWQRSVEADTDAGDAAGVAHYQQMIELTDRRIEEVRRNGTPDSPFIEVFNRSTNQVVGTFRSASDAQDFINHRSNPNNFEINDVTEQMSRGETAEQMAARADQTEARHPTERGYEIVTMEADGNERVVARVNTENEAMDYVVNRSRTNPDGPDLAYRQEGDAEGWQPNEQHPLSPSGGLPPDVAQIPPDYGNQPVGAPRLSQTRTRPISPTSADIPGTFGVYDYSNPDRRGRPTRIAGFETRDEGEAFMRTQPNRYDLDVLRSSLEEGTTSSYNAPVTAAPSATTYGPEMATHTQLREATGDLHPTIPLGKQPPVKVRTSITPEQRMRLLHTADKRVMREVYEANDIIETWENKIKERKARGEYGPSEPRPKTIYDKEGWEEFRNMTLGRIVPDPAKAGLFIEQYGGPDDFVLEYRAPDGRGVGYARVAPHEHVDNMYGDSDFRYVPALAIADNAGSLSARAFNAIGDGLRRLNALDTGNDTISQFTGRAVASIAAKFRDNSGSTTIHHEMKPLVTFLENVAKKYGSNAKANVMDVYADMTKYLSKSKKNLKWMAENLAGNETGAVSLPSWQDVKTKAGWSSGARGGDTLEAIGAIDAWEKIREKAGWGKGQRDPSETGVIGEMLAVPSAATTTGDFSAPGRQGLALINTKHFWNAAAAMFKGVGEKGFDKIDAELRNMDLHKKKIRPDGTMGPSMGEQIGSKLFSPATRLGPRAENAASAWLERGIGKTVEVNGQKVWMPTPGSKAWSKTFGVPIRATNRMYITFLNHLNTNRTTFLMDKLRDMSLDALNKGETRREGILGDLGFKQKYTPEQAIELNPYKNIQRGKEIADFVNTATGHGPLRSYIVPFKGTELNLESAAGAFNKVAFSPGLFASRFRMLMPANYIMATPFVRKQYLKAALATAGAWYGFTQLAKLADPDAEVGDDWTSADFGKVRIGDTRMDASGGFAQFLTMWGRLYQGGYTSSASQEFHRFGEDYQAETHRSNIERFLSNKLNPAAKFAYDLADATEYKPFHVGDRTMQLFVPLIVQDLVGLSSEDPELLPWMGPVAFGMGTQTYGKGESVGKLLAPENDWLYQGGGGFKDFMPREMQENMPFDFLKPR